jgi:hypothetical protein
MIDSCFGENRMKISCPYSEIYLLKRGWYTVNSKSLFYLPCGDSEEKVTQGISASRLAKHTIPTAAPMFLGSNFSLGLSVTLSDETGSQKSKMADGNNVISRISSNINDSNEFPTANLTFSGSSISMELLPTLSDVSGSRKPKMTACKPEVLLSQLVDKIET